MTLPGFRLVDAHSKEHSFPSDKYTLLVFMKEDCPTCHLSMPLVENAFQIFGSKINGIFGNINGNRNIQRLEVEDENLLSIISEDTELFSKKAFYDKEKSIIELFESVTIKRGSEIITGDYGVLDTNKNSYKVSSNNSNKVKVIISNTK